MKNLKKEFPVTTNYIHLNTAASGLLSETLLDFRQNHDLDYLVMGSLLKNDQDKFIDGVRKDVGSYFNCDASQVGLVPNFSLGFNAVLEALPKNSKIALLKEDYPSINWPVLSRGFKTCYAIIDENLENNILECVTKEKPDFLCLSLVQYISGIQVNFDFLKELKRAHPNLIIIADGTQYCGVESFNFKESGIDILGASAYKWMNAGYGNGFFLIKNEVTSNLKLKTTGFNSVRGAFKEEDDSFIGGLEPGHLDTLAQGSLQASIKLIKRIGQDQITNQIDLLKQKAMEVFSEKKLLDPIISKRGQHSSIFNIKGDQKLFNKLIENNIICSQRGTGIRVSFHYFNSEDDLTKLSRLI
tara:strand:+ start:319 stop:1389 length:1071 start_codon:yes stop_codon:yes gene_type:complete